MITAAALEMLQEVLMNLEDITKIVEGLSVGGSFAR